MFDISKFIRGLVNGSAYIIQDQSYAIAIRYIGSSASATITCVAATGITLKQGTAGAEAVDTTVGASANGVVDFATDTTLGAVVDRINASPNWEAEIIDGLRDDSTASSRVKALSEYTLTPKTEVKKLPWDTSVALELTHRVSARRDNFNRKQENFRAFLYQVKTQIDVGSGTLTLAIYSVNKESSATKLLATFAGVDDTELDAKIGDGSIPWVSEPGEDILIRYTTSADLPDTDVRMNVAAYNVPLYPDA